MKFGVKEVAVAIAATALTLAGGYAAAYATGNPPTSPPGQGDCEHGNSNKPCRDDPQPDHGKDCDEHGNKGGVNEDHCAGETTPTTPTTPTTTPTPTPTPTTPTTPTTPETPTTPTNSDPPTTTPTPSATTTASPVATAPNNSEGNSKPQPKTKPKVTVKTKTVVIRTSSKSYSPPKPCKKGYRYSEKYGCTAIVAGLG